MQLTQNYKKQLIQLVTNFSPILLGIFISINISTILGQTGDWGMLIAGIIAAIIETVNTTTLGAKRKLLQTLYKEKQKKTTKYINFINNLKIGILYGLFIEAFKLGS
jgi:hypothetical protein